MKISKPVHARMAAFHGLPPEIIIIIMYGYAMGRGRKVFYAKAMVLKDTLFVQGKMRKVRDMIKNMESKAHPVQPEAASGCRRFCPGGRSPLAACPFPGLLWRLVKDMAGMPRTARRARESQCSPKGASCDGNEEKRL